MLNTSALAADLAAPATRAWQAIREGAPQAQRGALDSIARDARLGPQLAQVLACSRFAAEVARRRPGLLIELSAEGALQAPLREGELETALEEQLAAGDRELGLVLRRLRQRQMLRIIWRDLNRLARTMETTRDLSRLADACIRIALRQCTAQLEEKFGVPVGARSGRRQELVVLAMGKLGGHELNLSSDIDLMFAYPEAGMTRGGGRRLSNEEFFTRVGRALIARLDAVDAEGFVFRVDMRLRPYGNSGALVHSYAALKAYYQGKEQGRDWERYALIKARPVTGRAEIIEPLQACLRPFIYRRYVDYSAIGSLRHMKRRIVAEVRRRGLHGNVKLGRGGIREIEFIAQCFQLIRGGRDVSLQRRELLPVLAECAALGCLPETAALELRQAYRFLRDTEHAIQAWEDRQTQELPADPLPRAALAQAMGFGRYEDFFQALEAHRERVARHFTTLIASAEEIDGASALWSAEGDARQFEALGFARARAQAERVQALFRSRRVQRLQAEGRERLDRFMPLLLKACAVCEDSDLALERVLPLVVAVARRSAYLLLLIENPPALADLTVLCAASPWIAEQLARHPALLDELLDRASLYSAPGREGLLAALRRRLSRLPAEDLEGHMDALRYFKAAQVLRVAASEITARLPLMKASDKLTFIAEVCLEQVLALAWAQLRARYGAPSRGHSGTGFVVLACGKLGGIEMSYASDLDLTFIYDAPAQGTTDGPRAVDNATFYTRLVQRMIHILNTRMGLGQLYDVDMRLRPSGASGLPVSSFSAFAHYQREEAWTWEHQALVRARPVAGDDTLARRVEALRREVLCRERDPRRLAEAVTAMREKMREHISASREAAGFHLKQGPGGIVDLEFMVQYAVLAGAAHEPSLAEYSDNVRILEALVRSGRLARAQGRALSDAYLVLRGAIHQFALQQRPPVAPAERFAAPRRAIRAAWDQMFSTGRDTASGGAGDTANADGERRRAALSERGARRAAGAAGECAKPDGGRQH